MQRNPLTREISEQSDFSFSKASKKSLRAFYKGRLNEMSFSQRRQKNKNINQLALNLPFWKTARFIAVYKALKQEPNLSSFCSVWGKKICFPVMEGRRLTFYTNQENLWKKSDSIVWEPEPKEKNRVELKDISVFLIPGLSFDRRGGRLGRGCAYYDRTLSVIKRSPLSKTQLNKGALFIGVAFTEQINRTALPLSRYDVLMDGLITDQFVLWPLHSGKGGK